MKNLFVNINRAVKAISTGIGYLHQIAGSTKFLGAKAYAELLISNKDVSKIEDNASFRILIVKERRIIFKDYVPSHANNCLAFLSRSAFSIDTM